MREDWVECKLEELSTYEIGGDWGKDITYEDDSYVEVYCIRGSEFRNWEKEKGKTSSLRKIKSDSYNKRKLLLNDIIVEISGGGPEQPVGRTVLIDKEALNHFKDNRLVFTNFLRLIRPSCRIKSSFLNLYLKFFYSTGNIHDYQAGSNNLRNLKFDKYLSLEIPLPPLPEQRAIVKKIEALFSSLDAGIADLKKAQDQLKIYRQAVLKKAFEGELTKEWREKQTNLPTAEELKSDIQHRLSKHKIMLKFPEIESSQYYIPHGWISTRNESILFYVTSGSRDWKKYYSDKGSIFVRTQNINKNFLDLTDVAYVDLPSKVEGKRSLIEKNDLLMTITGANVGKTAVIDKEIPEAYVSQSVALLKYFPTIFTKFYSYFFQAESHGKKGISNLVYGVGRPVLSLENMREVEVLYCSYNEQAQIVKEIESRLSVCDAVEQQIKDSLSQAEALRQSILKKAFEGKLLTEEEIKACQQAPDYESASVLLEKIKAEKEANKTSKKIIKGKPKKKMEKKEILQLLAENNNEILVDQLWKNSVYAEDVDAFYLKLKELAEAGKITEVKNGKKVSIKLI